MAKLKEILEKIFETGNLPKNITPYEADRLVDIYNDLLSGRKSEFIESNIKDVLDSCGIKTEAKGVGWVAYL